MPVTMREPTVRTDVALEVANVSKHFGGIQALSDISLSARTGHVLGLIGPNGAGKTTLVNVITGMVKPDSGSVRISGEDVTDQPAHARVRQGMSRTFQNIRLFRQLSVLENVTVAWHYGNGFKTRASLLPLPGELRARRAGREAARNALNRVGLDSSESRVADQLAYGDQRRLEIARALATEPRVILLDEPAAGLNSFEAEALLEVISGLRSDGLTVVLVEHNMQLVMDVSDEIAVLSSGAKIASGKPAEIAANSLVREVYLG